MSKMPKTLTPEECQKLLHMLLNPFDAATPQPATIRNYLMAVLMLDAGLRVGELVQLRVSDLWFGDHPCYNLIIRAEIAKRNKERIIPMSERLIDAVAKAYANNLQWQQVNEKVYAFRTCGNEEHITPRRVQQIIGASAIVAIGRPVHPHVLRHTFATRLMAKTNIRVVQQLLGHSSLQSTQIYTHPNQEDLVNAINGI